MHNYLPSLSSLQWRKGYESEKVRVERESVQVLQQKLLLLPFLAKTQCKGQSKVKELLIYLSKKKKKRALLFTCSIFNFLPICLPTLLHFIYFFSIFLFLFDLYFQGFLCVCVRKYTEIFNLMW